MAVCTRASGSLIAPTAEKSAIEMALVGPLTSCRDDAKSAPTIVITIAVYSPYSGGTPTISAYAIACGTATAATEAPATTSPRRSTIEYRRNSPTAGSRLSTNPINPPVGGNVEAGIREAANDTVAGPRGRDHGREPRTASRPPRGA